ncbi:hypothetical protein EBL89_04445 [Cereibacter sphaeroides]|nr:hypothetical protein EBL89_04445 [Cereibacter sphaeroides]AZB58862.1 hypothetical protein EBL88_04415 [Cereibacter sphaeroides]
MMPRPFKRSIGWSGMTHRSRYRERLAAACGRRAPDLPQRDQPAMPGTGSADCPDMSDLDRSETVRFCRDSGPPDIDRAATFSAGAMKIDAPGPPQTPVRRGATLRLLDIAVPGGGL